MKPMLQRDRARGGIGVLIPCPQRSPSPPGGPPHDHGRTTRSGCAGGGAGPAAGAARSPRSTAATRSTRESWMMPGVQIERLQFPRDLDEAAADDEGRAERRPGSESAVGHRAHRAARALHPLLPDLVDDRPSAALDRHQRELAVAARMLEGGVSRRACRRRRSRVLSVLVRAVPRLLGRLRGRLPDGPALHSRRRDVEPDPPRADRVSGRDGRLLHADLRPAAGGDRRARAAARPLAESTVRVLIVAGEPGGSIPADARAHRAELGRSGHRSPRPDRGRSGQLRMLGGAGLPARQRGRVHRRSAGSGDRPAGR